MNQDQLLHMRILAVDDEPVNIALLRDLLDFSGFTQIESTTNPREVMAIFRARRPDLILLDLNMPFIDGFGVLKLLGEEIAAEEYIPILVLTADISVETKRKALGVGATDFLTKPFDPVEVLLRITNLLRTRHQHLQLCDQKALLEDSVRERTAELRQTLHQLRDAQAQAIQHERLSALGSMTAGIAHDFNNVLSLILGYSEMLLRSLRQPNGVKTADALLGTIITAAQDAAKMFSRLREFYRPADKGQRHEMLNLNSLIIQAIELTRPRWHGQAMAQGVNIHVDTDLCEDLPELLADGSELREMLTNLIFNAVDALPQGGTLHLTTRVEPAPPGFASTPALPGGNAALGAAAGAGEPVFVIALELADTGTGMSEEVRRRCLEPFFTTKGKQGTGLGLAMVYGIVQRHHGTIDLRSAPGEGTTFRFLFPIGRRPEPVGKADPTECLRPLRILAVDDQPVLCEILVEYLSEDWHTVEVAGAGEEALAKFRAQPFDLVITDRAMPGITGEQLAAGIKAINPQTRVILLTGYGSAGERGNYSTCIDLVVDKPATRETLRRAIGKVMAGHEDAVPATPRQMTDSPLGIA
jgi:signal transduction histidine kinase